MDEPLSNLDAKLRVEMRSVIRHTQKSVGITTVYVTHDQEEAMAISDRIAVMKDAATNDAMTPMADINVIEEDIPYVSAHKSELVDKMCIRDSFLSISTQA